MNDYVTELGQNLSVKARFKITCINVVSVRRRGNRINKKYLLNHLLTEKTKSLIAQLSGSCTLRRA